MKRTTRSTKSTRSKTKSGTSRQPSSRGRTITKLRPKARLVASPADVAPKAIPLTWAGKVPHIAPGKYEDGLPLHELTYLAFKLVLQPASFVSRESFYEFGKMIRRLAATHGIGFSRWDPADNPLRIREVLFVDTPDHRFYNNAFILRRRIEYEDGFPVGDPEVVFKYRSPNIQKAAETDVRPHITGPHRIKFKAQAVPLRGELGGLRMLFSHNVQFPRSNARSSDMHSMDVLTEIFPVLDRIKKSRSERIALVNDTIIEEVLQDIGELDFDHGLTAKTNVGIWRTRGEHRPLIGELGYQIKFKKRHELAPEAMKKAERFFIALQYAAKDVIALNATKTGIVYRLLGNAPTAHE